MSLLDTFTVQTPSELEQRRRDIILLFTTKYKGYDDPEVPLDLLRELALITSTLRRKNAGPPKAKRSAAGAGGVGRKPTLDDI